MAKKEEFYHKLIAWEWNIESVDELETRANLLFDEGYLVIECFFTHATEPEYPHQRHPILILILEKVEEIE